MCGQRDRMSQALATAVAQLDRERAAVRASRAENARNVEEIKNERATVAELQSSVEAVTAERESLDRRIQEITKEHLKLQETHARLGTMAQESLAELSELRQRADSLSNEKKRVEEKTKLQDEQVTALTREVDDLRLELNRTREAVRVIQENGEDRGQNLVVANLTSEKERLEAQTTAQKGQIVTLSQQVVDLRGELARGSKAVPPADAVADPVTVYGSARKLVVDRYKKALNGEIAWDTFDVISVSSAGGVVILVLLSMLFCVRHLRLRRWLKELQIHVDELELEFEAADEAEEGGQFQEREPASRRREVPVVAERSVAREHVGGAATRRLSPAEFSPIMRSRGKSAGEVAPVDDAPAAKSLAPVADRNRVTSGSSRRIIGAWHPDEQEQVSTRGSADSRRELVSEHAAASRPEQENSCAQTQILSNLDLDPPAGGGPAAPSGAGDESKSRGTSEEQDFLNELRSIIHKKFDDVLDSDDD